MCSTLFKFTTQALVQNLKLIKYHTFSWEQGDQIMSDCLFRAVFWKLHNLPTLLCSVFQKYVWITNVSNLATMGWATFWAIFSQTHPVTCLGAALDHLNGQIVDRKIVLHWLDVVIKMWFKCIIKIKVVIVILFFECQLHILCNFYVDFLCCEFNSIRKTKFKRQFILNSPTLLGSMYLELHLHQWKFSFMNAILAL
jgi:hypothetical protein